MGPGPYGDDDPVGAIAADDVIEVAVAAQPAAWPILGRQDPDQPQREVGTRARQALEELLGRRVFLELFVRVEPDWARNNRRLRELGL